MNTSITISDSIPRKSIILTRGIQPNTNISNVVETIPRKNIIAGIVHNNAILKVVKRIIRIGIIMSVKERKDSMGHTIVNSIIGKNIKVSIGNYIQSVIGTIENIIVRDRIIVSLRSHYDCVISTVEDFIVRYCVIFCSIREINSF
jgi:hypothetical protein